MRKIILNPVFSSDDFGKDLIFIKCTLGYDGEINMLFADKKYDNLKNKIISAFHDNGSIYRKLKWFKIKPETPQNYRLILPEKNKVICFNNQKINYTHGLQIDENKYCLACRTREDGFRSRLNNNCKIIDEKGTIINEFPIGSGVEDIQTSSRNEIWVSFSDFGYFDNGGKFRERALICLDEKGEVLHEYTDSPEMCECAGLNVCSDKNIIILAYSGNYAYIVIRNNKLDKKICDHKYISHSFAFLNNKLLIEKHRYSSDNKSKYSLFDISNLEEEIESYDFYNEKNENLSCVHAQKDILFFWNSKKLYKVSIKELE